MTSKLSEICVCCNDQQLDHAADYTNDPLFSCDLPHKVLFFADAKERSDLDVERERKEIREAANLMNAASSSRRAPFIN